MARSPGEWFSDVLMLFTILICTGIGLVIATLLYAYIRATLREKGERRDVEASERAKYRRDGRALPPSHRGLCEGCEKVFEKVYILPSGQRFCPGCYEEFDPVETD